MEVWFWKSLPYLIVWGSNFIEPPLRFFICIESDVWNKEELGSEPNHLFYDFMLRVIFLFLSKLLTNFFIADKYWNVHLITWAIFVRLLGE